MSTQKQDYRPGIYFVREADGTVRIWERADYPDDMVQRAWYRIGRGPASAKPTGEILSGPYTAAQLSAFPLLVEAAQTVLKGLTDFDAYQTSIDEERWAELLRAALAAAK